MRSKEKTNISGQLKPATFEKLKQIGADQKLNQIKTIAFLIDNYNPDLILVPGSFASIEDKGKFKSDFKELTKSAPVAKVKSASSEPTMAELLRQAYQPK